MRGFVYVISAGPERHKIGRAGDPRARLQALQCGVPDTLSLVHTVEVSAMVKAEAAAHERFRDRHLRGEWFSVTKAEAVEALDEIAKSYPLVEPPAPTPPAGDAETASGLGSQALALMIANMAGRYGVLTQGADRDALAFTGEVLMMEASWRLLHAADDGGQRFFGSRAPFIARYDADEEDGSL